MSLGKPGVQPELLAVVESNSFLPAAGKRVKDSLQSGENVRGFSRLLPAKKRIAAFPVVNNEDGLSGLRELHKIALEVPYARAVGGARRTLAKRCFARNNKASGPFAVTAPPPSLARQKLVPFLRPVMIRMPVDVTID